MSAKLHLKWPSNPSLPFSRHMKYCCWHFCCQRSHIDQHYLECTRFMYFWRLSFIFNSFHHYTYNDNISQKTCYPAFSVSTWNLYSAAQQWHFFCCHSLHLPHATACIQMCAACTHLCCSTVIWNCAPFYGKIEYKRGATSQLCSSSVVQLWYSHC